MGSTLKWLKALLFRPHAVRIICAVTFLFLGLGLGVVALINGRPLAALTLALSGIYAGSVIFLGMNQSINNPMFQVAAGAIGAIGIMGVFLYSRAFDLNLQATYGGLVIPMMQASSVCPTKNPELSYIAEFGVKACSTQMYRDQQSATVELLKEIHFGPVSSILDSSVDIVSNPDRNFCAEAFKVANELCGPAFLSVSARDQELLLREVR